MPDPNNNGWNEWSRHVLKELERLNENYEILREMNQEIKEEMGKTSQIKDDLEIIKKWKERVDDVVSPTQLADLSKEVSDLKTFKTTAITVWLVIQGLTAFILAAFKIF